MWIPHSLTMHSTQAKASRMNLISISHWQSIQLWKLSNDLIWIWLVSIQRNVNVWLNLHNSVAFTKSIKTTDPNNFSFWNRFVDTILTSANEKNPVVNWHVTFALVYEMIGNISMFAFNYMDWFLWMFAFLRNIQYLSISLLFIFPQIFFFSFSSYFQSVGYMPFNSLGDCVYFW